MRGIPATVMEALLLTAIVWAPNLCCVGGASIAVPAGSRRCARLSRSVTLACAAGRVSPKVCERMTRRPPGAPDLERGRGPADGDEPCCREKQEMTEERLLTALPWRLS